MAVIFTDYINIFLADAFFAKTIALLAETFFAMTELNTDFDRRSTFREGGTEYRLLITDY